MILRLLDYIQHFKRVPFRGCRRPQQLVPFHTTPGVYHVHATGSFYVYVDGFTVDRWVQYYDKPSHWESEVTNA